MTDEEKEDFKKNAYLIAEYMQDAIDALKSLDDLSADMRERFKEIGEIYDEEDRIKAVEEIIGSEASNKHKKLSEELDVLMNG